MALDGVRHVDAVPPLVGPGRPTFAQALGASLRPQKVPLAIKAPAFTDGGESAIFFNSEELVRSETPLRWSVIAKCSYGRPSIPEIKSCLMQRLDLKSSVVISNLNQRHILLRFELEDDFLKVLVRKSLYLKGYLFRFFRWTPTFDFNHDPTIIPIWVGFPELPVNLYNEDYLVSIAGNLGSVVRIHDATLAWTQTAEALVCVDIDITKELKERIWIGMGDHGYWQKIRYHRVPSVCGFCRRIGHKEEECNKKNNKDGKTQDAAAGDPDPTKKVGSLNVAPEVNKNKVAGNEKAWRQVPGRARAKVQGNVQTGISVSNIFDRLRTDVIEEGETSGDVGNTEAHVVLPEKCPLVPVPVNDKHSSAKDLINVDSTVVNEGADIEANIEAHIHDGSLVKDSFESAVAVNTCSADEAVASGVEINNDVIQKGTTTQSGNDQSHVMVGCMVREVALGVAPAAVDGENCMGMGSPNLDGLDLIGDGHRSMEVSQGVHVNHASCMQESLRAEDNHDLEDTVHELNLPPDKGVVGYPICMDSPLTSNVDVSTCMDIVDGSIVEKYGKKSDPVVHVNAPGTSDKEGHAKCGVSMQLSSPDTSGGHSTDAPAVADLSGDGGHATSTRGIPMQSMSHGMLGGLPAGSADLKSPEASSGPRMYKSVLQTPQATTDLVTKDVSSYSSGSRKMISRPSRKGGVRICLPVTRVRSPSPPPPAVNYQTKFNMEAARAVMEQSRAENIFMPGYTFPSGDSDDHDDDEDTFYDERCSRRPGLRPRGVLRRKHSFDDLSLEF